MSWCQTRDDSSAQEPTGEQRAERASAGILPLEDYRAPLGDRQYLSGDWAGFRTRLQEAGLTIGLDWTQFVQGVTRNGLDQGFEYGSSADLHLNLDLDRSGLVPGGLISVRIEGRYGDSVLRDAGTLSPVNNDLLAPLTRDLDEEVIAVTALNYTQFLGERFALFLGKFDSAESDLNEFASGEGVHQFANSALNWNPVSGVAVAPYSSLGVGFSWQPHDDIRFVGSLYDNEDASTTSGFDTGFEGPTGVVGELYLQHRLADRPGGQMFGYAYAWNGEFTLLDSRQVGRLLGGQPLATVSDTWAIYWNFWQYLWIFDEPENIDLADFESERGLGVFARAGMADDRASPAEWFLSLGIGGRGLIPSRESDSFGVGYYRMDLPEGPGATLLDLDDREQGLEAYYRIEVLPSFYLTPSVQVIDSGLKSSGTVTIVGVRARLSF